MKNKPPYPYLEEPGIIYNGVNSLAKERLLKYFKEEALPFIDRCIQRRDEDIIKLEKEIDVPIYLVKTDLYKKKIPINNKQINSHRENIRKLNTHKEAILKYIEEDDFNYVTLIELPCFRRWL